MENTTSANPYFNAAFDIGIQLTKNTLWDGSRCNWLGSSVEYMNGSFQVVQKTFSADFYSGTSGIALFLAMLLAKQPDELIKETMTGAVNHVISILDNGDISSDYSYYGGRLGIAAMLISIGNMHDRKDWEQKGHDILLSLCKNQLQESEVDVVAGAAGAIPALIDFYNIYGDAELKEAAVACGDFLIDKALKTHSYWSWPAVSAPGGMTGYSHGAAGIATALLSLYHATNNTGYFNAAMMGYNYERVNFSAQMQNWPDFRDPSPDPAKPQSTPQPPGYGVAWCHGAPGIALSRLKAWQLTGDAYFRQEAEIGLATTYRSIAGLIAGQTAVSNFSVCHGIAGNADVLLEGSAVFSNPAYRQLAYEVGNYGLEKYYRQGLNWPSGVNDPTGATPGMAETPGFMLGLAGTGYFYLRLAFPGEIKSRLLL